MSQRMLKHQDISVSNLSARPGLSRIAWSGDAVLKWKGNLTALSQRESLYFIALRHVIYVDRPGFPDQRMSENGDVHDLRWELPSSDAQIRRNFHNRRYPHGVNRIEIGYLGSQEALICACDDGDVVVYFTGTIVAAFDAIDSGANQADAVNKFIKPTSLFNVGISAWGVALQREARLIAVSSNDHKIRVVATALCQAYEDHLKTPGELVPQISCPGHSTPIDRTEEAMWSLNAHCTNIPDVTFYRSSAQASDIFLLSSDISSNVFVWNITKGSQLVHKICPEQLHDTHQYGWITLAIDHQVFRLVATEAELNRAAAPIEPTEDSIVISEQMQRPSTPLPCAIVHTRSQQLSLIISDDSPPAVRHTSPWRDHDRGPPFEGPHLDFGTLKFARQIPELGVVVVASDSGYAGIFGLSRLMQGTATSSRRSNAGLRLEALLPFDNQVPLGVHEHRGLNLWGGLIGIATGPMQGDKTDRFRLIMEYGDRTVLCYELSRTDVISSRYMDL